MSIFVKIKKNKTKQNIRSYSIIIKAKPARWIRGPQHKVFKKGDVVDFVFSNEVKITKITNHNKKDEIDLKTTQFLFDEYNRSSWKKSQAFQE